MREILFRGKMRTGQWIYGTGWTEFLNMFPDKTDNLCLWSDHQWIEIIPETLGQYTGLKDKNGKMIFEGDILRSVHFESNNETHYLYHIVEWSDRLSGWYMKNTHSNTKDGHVQAWVYFKNAIMPEVIGNIHDNP